VVKQLGGTGPAGARIGFCRVGTDGATDAGAVVKVRMRAGVDAGLVVPRTRRWVLGAGSAGAAGLLAACGAAGQSGQSEKALQVSKPVTITAWLPPTGNYTDYLNSQVALFQQSQDKVKITVEPPGATDKLQAAILAGDPPNIQQANYIPMFMWQLQEALEPVDPYLDKRGKSDYFDWARDGSTVKGKLYEWPWMLNPTGGVVNKSLLAERGASNLVPQQGVKADWTVEQWRALLKAAAKVTGDETRDVYGTAFMGTTTWYWEMMYLWGNGAEIYNKDETKVVVNSPEGVAGLQMLVDVQFGDRLAAPNPADLDAAKTAELYYTKRLGLLGGSNSNIGEVERRLRGGTIIAPLESAFVPPPHAPGKKPAAFVAIQSFLVFKQTKDHDRTVGAMQLGRFLTDTPAQKEITSIGELPVRKSAGNIYASDPNRTTGFAVVENGRSMGRFPENGEVRTLWQDAIRSVWRREKSPKEALDSLVRLSEPIMAKNAARGGTQ
jgi:ABC-type glycerol-3-phosphate transport system substrate-binding protein